MVLFSKFKSLDNNIGKRILKVMGLGGAMTAKESMPFGLDGNPLANMTAIYSGTSNASERVVIGYINNSQLAETGETRLYSLDSNGALKAFIWNKADGQLWLNGGDYSAARYEPLNTLLASLQNQINTQLTAIATGVTGAGGTYVPTPINIQPSTIQSPTVKLK